METAKQEIYKKLVPQFFSEFVREAGFYEYQKKLLKGIYIPSRRFSRKVYNFFGIPRPEGLSFREELEWLLENWKGLRKNYLNYCREHHSDRSPNGYFWVITYAWSQIKKRKKLLESITCCRFENTRPKRIRGSEN